MRSFTNVCACITAKIKIASYHSPQSFVLLIPVRTQSNQWCLKSSPPELLQVNTMVDCCYSQHLIGPDDLIIFFGASIPTRSMGFLKVRKAFYRQRLNLAWYGSCYSSVWRRNNRIAGIVNSRIQLSVLGPHWIILTFDSHYHFFHRSIWPARSPIRLIVSSKPYDCAICNTCIRNWQSAIPKIIGDNGGRNNRLSIFGTLFFSNQRYIERATTDTASGRQ